MDQAAQKGAGRDYDSPCPKRPTIGQAQPGNPAIGHDQLVRLAFDNAKTFGLADRGLHCGGVEFSIRLSPGTANGGPLTAVQHPELDSASVCNPTHQAIESVHLANKMPLPETADGGIAGHRADRRKAMRHQRRGRTHPRSGSRSFTAGVTAANHDDVEALSLCSHEADF
jgi:hypothetical protein